MRISFSGAQSTGKTTLLNLCQAKYANQFTFIPEVTRVLKKQGYPINEKGTDATQLQIIIAHLENSWKTNVIMDRCMLDGVIYTEYLHQIGQVNLDTLSVARMVSHMLCERYDCIFYTDPRDVLLQNDGTRSTSINFRNSIIELFDRYIESGGWKNIHILSGTVEARMSKIDSILTQLAQQKSCPSNNIL